MTAEEERISNLVRKAFEGVRLGDGIGLWQAQGIDDYESESAIAAYRERDEKEVWSSISSEDLERC